MKTLEQIAQAATMSIADYISNSHGLQLDKGDSANISAIITRNFAGMQGGNEKLREALDQAAKDIGRLLGRARFTTPEDAAALPRIKEALAQSSDDGRKELVEALKRIAAQRNNRYESTVGIMADIADEALKLTHKTLPKGIL